ncbi:MAG: sulfatase-like hydrolase/transferase [Armatimonadota bacterium]|nr:sulfatase-like hydrolase/transferase [Armatimonadota bacterium]
MSSTAATPNIIFFLTDQQRWDTVGRYGNRMGITPNLDRMADEGILFQSAFSCQPVCGPARACIQTGRYGAETGCFRNQIALPASERTIAHYLSEAGYEVGYIGKWHLASTMLVPGVENRDCITKPVPLELRGGWKDYWLASDTLEFTSHGYDGYLFDGDMKKVDFKGYRVDCLTDFALDYLRNRDKQRPFFLFLSYVEPHHQNDRNRYEGPTGSRDRFRDFEVPGDLQDTEGDWRESYPDYLGCCASLDRNLGRLRRELEELGLSENTLVVYTSDHGCHFRTRNDEYKRSCHDASIRIPMIAKGPRFTGGKAITELVSLIDLPPTLLAAGGLGKPPAMRGRHLQELVSGTAVDWPEEVFIQISENHIGRAIRTKRWKYSIWAPDGNGMSQPGSARYVEQCLYDLADDPHEKNNLVSDPARAETRAGLAQVLKRRMAEAGEATPEIRPAEPDCQV